MRSSTRRWLQLATLFVELCLGLSGVSRADAHANFQAFCWHESHGGGGWYAQKQRERRDADADADAEKHRKQFPGHRVRVHDYVAESNNVENDP